MVIAVLLHTLAAVVWVGGMFLAYVVLRPVAAQQLDPPARLVLWCGVFGRFFPWVFVSITVLPVTGLWMVFAVLGGFGSAGLHVQLMFWAGIAMMLIFLYVYFAPFRLLKKAVAAEDWRGGGRQLARIRILIAVNLAIGLLVVAIASGGRYLSV